MGFGQPLDQSCCTVAGPLGSGAALATGVIVARLRTMSVARSKYVMGIFHLWPGEMSGFERQMDLPAGQDNRDFVDWIYAL